MPKPERWTAVIPGLAVTGVLVATIVAVLALAHVGVVRGPTMRLYLTTSAAHGVLPGAEVWLDGERVGRVAALDLQPPAGDPGRRLLIAMDVRAGVRPFIRRDTRAEIRTGSSFIGAPVVSLTGGSAGAAAIADRDTLRTTSEREAADSRAQIAAAARDLPVILDNYESVRTQVFSGGGTVGAFASDTGGRRFAALASAASRLAGRVSATRHPGARAMRSDAARPATPGAPDTLVVRGRALLAEAGRLRRRVAAAPLGRLAGDTTLAHEIRDTRTELAAVRSLLAPRAGGDTGGDTVAAAPVAAPSPGSDVAALRRQLAGADSSLHELLADVVHRPLRYIVFY